jgi:hypothetical protein
MTSSVLDDAIFEIALIRYFFSRSNPFYHPLTEAIIKHQNIIDSSRALQ